MIRALVIISLLFTLFSCQKEDKVQLVELPDLTLIVPQNYITAGSNISIQTVNPIVEDSNSNAWQKGWNGTVELWIDNGLTLHQEKLNIANTYDEFDLSGQLFTTAGLYDLSLRKGTHTITREKLLVKSSDLVDPIEVFSGPTTVWVDDRQEFMVVGVARDSFGNLARENDSIKYQIQFPSNLREESYQRIEDRVAFNITKSGEIEGPIKTGVGIEGVSSKEQLTDAVALWPAQLRINVSELNPYADGRSFFKVQTEKVRDIKGRVVADGTFVEFVLDFNQKQTKYQSYTIDGIATCLIRNPSQPGKRILSAIAAGNQSLSKSVTFQSNVKEVNYTIGSDYIDIGPVSSYIGQYLPDGTEVVLRTNEKEWIQELEDGKTRFELMYVEGMTLEISDYQTTLTND